MLDVKVIFFSILRKNPLLGAKSRFRSQNRAKNRQNRGQFENKFRVKFEENFGKICANFGPILSANSSLFREKFRCFLLHCEEIFHSI